MDFLYFEIFSRKYLRINVQTIILIKACGNGCPDYCSELSNTLKFLFLENGSSKTKTKQNTNHFQIPKAPKKCFGVAF